MPRLAQRENVRSAMPWFVVVLAALAWFGFWYLTPGLVATGVGNLVSDDIVESVSIETAVAGALAIVLVLTHRRYNRILFARSRTVWLYAIPLGLAAVLPLHYSLALPVHVYLVWMSVSVFWQDYLTFGLLQSYLGERLPTRAVIVISAVMFWLGHALFIPDRFAPTQVLPSLAILALGFLFGSLRVKLTTLHVLLALHLSFYFALA